MKDLSGPCSYRFFKPQKAWIQQRAREEGHGSEVVYLRQLVERDMKRAGRKSSNRAKKAVG